MLTVDTKKCCRCKQSKPLAAFAKSKGKKDGLFDWCRDCCAKAYQKKRDAEIEEQLANVVSLPYSSIGETIRNKRQSLGITQKQFGERVGVGWAQVMSYEKGRTLPKQDKLAAMFALLGMEQPLETLRRGGRIPIEVRECFACGRKFPAYRIGTKHCSRKCLGATKGKSQIGEAHHNWKGRSTSLDGYVTVKAHGHPSANKLGYIREHRLVMEEMIGRQLEPHERVHHKNGDRGDNRPENLELWKVKKKDPAGVRAADYHCPGCRCFEHQKANE